ncbi:MAG: hypothetical protein NVS2B8_11810 [Vulcanimicrobiaceae bacterium]
MPGMRRVTVLTLIAACCVPVAAATRDTPLHVALDGRLIDARVPSGRLRDGIAFVDVSRAVHAVGGLLTLTRRSARVTMHGRTLEFSTDRPTGELDGDRVALQARSFVTDGDFFVPVRGFSTLANLTMTLDRRGGRVTLARGGVGFDRVRGDADDDVVPSPTQALRFALSGTLEGTSVHARLEVVNVSGRPYALVLPTARRISFVLARDGVDVWTAAGAAPGEDPPDVPASGGRGSKIALRPGESIVFERDWHPGAALVPGRYTLRARIATPGNLEVAIVSLGVEPGPAKSP